MRPIHAGAAAALLAASVTAAAIATTAGGQGTAGRTISLTEVPQGASFAFVDNPPRTKFTREGEPRRLSPGDLEIESITVANAQGAHVGRFHVYCILTRPGVVSSHQEECTGTYRLSNGTITVTDVFAGSESSDWTAAIVGGTDAYEGATATSGAEPTRSGCCHDRSPKWSRRTSVAPPACPDRGGAQRSSSTRSSRALAPAAPAAIGCASRMSSPHMSQTRASGARS